MTCACLDMNCLASLGSQHLNQNKHSPIMMINSLFPRHGVATLLLVVSSLAACAPAADPQNTQADEVSAAPTSAPSGDWSLQAADSQLSFVSIKNNAITEVHRFNDLSGSVSADGMASLSIELDSVDTGIEIRDQRMREMLFETGLHPQAQVSMKVDPQLVSGLKAGEFERLETSATLALHGLSVSVPVVLRVSRLDAHHWLVTSEQPVVVNASAFNLLEGLDKLREIAGLQAIGGGAPVTFALLFKRG